MIKLLKFDQVPLPIYKEVKGKNWIYYGERNDYPDYLLRIYNNSAKNNAIITGKVDYICGNGWEAKSDNEIQKAKVYGLIDSVNKDNESLNEVTKKIATDLSIFGGYYLQVNWTKATGEIAEIYHIDYYKVRTNAENSEFYVSDEWIKNNSVNSNPEYTTYPAFDPKNAKGSQIIYYKEYRAGANTYSLPDYRGCITYIELDISIAEYHLNTINNGMFSSKLINLNQGRVSQEEQDRIERQFQSKFSGSKNAGKFMLAFNDSKENEPSIIDLSGTELDKHFDLLNKSVQQEIFTGHKITSPMLFGIKTEGQLGGRAELRDASELFQNTYINTKQKSLEEVINYLYSFNNISARLELKRIEPIGFEFSEQIISANMTQDEIRTKLGLDVIDKNETNDNQQLINSLNSLNPTLLGKVLENLSSKELRGLIGLDLAPTAVAITGPVVQRVAQSHDDSHTTCFSSVNDEEILSKFEGKGVSKEHYKIIKQDKLVFSSMNDFIKQELFADYELNGLQTKILDEIKADPSIKVEDIAAKLVIQPNIVKETITKLVDDMLITEKVTTKDGEKILTRKITKVGDNAIRKIVPISAYKVLYSYEERPNVPPAKSGSRPLCQKLYNSGLFFTREEIQSISSQLGYSVFTLCGGWYHNPDTNMTTPYCRHEWRRNVVIEKTSR